MAATVLVVDDEPPIIEIIREILESRGYRVLATSDSERALAMLDEDPGPIHILLTDVMMRDRSGPELAVRVQHRWPDVKVIFMSGHSLWEPPRGRSSARRARPRQTHHPRGPAVGRGHRARAASLER